MRGRVQGVHFREFVRWTAARRGLTGYVRNLPDGSTVEIYAEGDSASLEALLRDLHTGPGLSRVDAVEERWCDPEGGLEEFSIVW